jgi:Cu/Ag efflux pump CusA
LVHWLKTRYEPLLTAVLRRWKVVGATAFGGLVAALVALWFAGQSFLPDFNEGTLTISTATLPGTSLQESAELGGRVEEILLQQPEVVATARRTGRAELDEHAQDVNAAEIDVGLKMQGRSKEELLTALRREFSLITCSREPAPISRSRSLGTISMSSAGSPKLSAR